MPLAFKVFLVLIGCSNILLATAWAKYGVLEVGIRRPVPVSVVLGFLVHLSAWVVLWLAFGRAGLKLDWEKAALITLAIPTIWIFFYRYVCLPAGMYDFNRASARTNQWKMSHFRPGQILTEEGSGLAEFGFALGALKLFDRSIKAQRRGSHTRLVRTIELTDDLMGWDNTIRLQCMYCPIEHKLPIHALPEGVEYVCGMCGAHLTARRQGDAVVLTGFNLSHRVVGANHRLNIAIAHREKAMLLRMMNRFDEADTELNHSQTMMDRLMADSPDSTDVLTTQSMVHFYRGEFAHACGRKAEARDEY
jgi:hypothetical protein